MLVYQMCLGDVDDLEPLFAMIRETNIRGDTYPHPNGMDDRDVHHVWVEKTTAHHVAVDDGEIVGTYYLKPNQPSRGSHVCNAGYIVSGGALCQHSQDEARKLGFKAMQYNLVVSSNETAVRLWQRHGFRIFGNLPKAFHHRELGLVDAYVMYKWLADG
jgi:hypothetical protein